MVDLKMPKKSGSKQDFKMKFQKFEVRNFKISKIGIEILTNLNGPVADA